MLERIRAGFTLAGAFGEQLEVAEVVDGFTTIIEPHVTDDFVCVMDGGAMITTYEGVEGLRSGWADFLGAFEALAIEPGEMREGADGDCVVEFVKLSGKPAGVDATIEEDAAAVWRMRGGKLSAVEFHMDRSRALHAGGLQP